LPKRKVCDFMWRGARLHLTGGGHVRGEAREKRERLPVAGEATQAGIATIGGDRKGKGRADSITTKKRKK